MADLLFPVLGCRLSFGGDASHVLRHPVVGAIDFILVHGLGTADNLELVDVLHVDAEEAHPLRRTDGTGVHVNRLWVSAT